MGDATPKGNDTIAPVPAAEVEILDLGDAISEYQTTAPPGLTVGERIALGTHGLRKTVAVCMSIAFIVMNGLVMIGLYLALEFDFRMIEAGLPDYAPFITENVVMSLLGATTVQLGAITFTMAKFLFPNRPNGG